MNSKNDSRRLGSSANSTINQKQNKNKFIQLQDNQNLKQNNERPRSRTAMRDSKIYKT